MYTLEDEYGKDDKLKKDDVKSLQVWVESQPHLPKLTELEALWFLQSCYYSNENAKIALDNYYSVRTQERDIFQARDEETIRENYKVATMYFLSQRTPQGDRVLYATLTEKDSSKFNFLEELHIMDDLYNIELKLHGTSIGSRAILDAKNISIGYVTKLNLNYIRVMLNYLQEAVPIRLKGVHIINIKPIVDTIYSMCKPFMKKELIELIHFHKDLDDLAKFIPIECLPSDLGGKDDSVDVLGEKMLKMLLDNNEIGRNLDLLLVDESKRPGKPRESSQVFGVQGTFKKLELD